MMCEVHLLVGPDDDGKRLDSILGAHPELPSRSACVRLIQNGCVWINETCATSKSEAVALGDRITVFVGTTTVCEAAGGLLAPNADISLDVRYEDEYLLVISKQAGLVCHPSPGHVNDTLANALVAHCGYAHLGLLQGEDRPGIVHRLDQDTSGLMVCAKTDEVQRALQDLIRLRVLDRRYITLVHGFVAHDSGSIESGIARSKKDRLRMTVSNEPQAREAITTFRTLERFEAGRTGEGYSLLECHLYTGRTHQIRVHMRHIQHPCVGDQLYGRAHRSRDLKLSRQFLHSWHISFEHPITGELIKMHDSLPEDLHNALASIMPTSMGRTSVGERLVPLVLEQIARS